MKQQLGGSRGQHQCGKERDLDGDADDVDDPAAAAAAQLDEEEGEEEGAGLSRPVRSFLPVARPAGRCLAASCKEQPLSPARLSACLPPICVLPLAVVRCMEAAVL